VEGGAVTGPHHGNARLALLLVPVLPVILLAAAGAGVASIIFGASDSATCNPTPPASPAPGSAAPDPAAPDPAGSGAAAGGVAGYTGDQIGNAATIAAVGRQLAVPPQGQVVALAAAIQESGLRNLDHGDSDSLGLFQQRPSQGWGTPAQIMNPTHAAAAFYQHLLAVPDWQQISVNDAAQAVQHSAFPHAYARHEQAARALLATVQGATCTTTATSTAAAQQAVAFAEAAIGTPYEWGGNGPPNDWGYDCSGLTRTAYAAVGITLPRTAQQQYDTGPLLPASTPPEPGDLLFYGTPAAIHHVGIYLGNGQMIDAPTFGLTVRIDTVQAPDYAGASRPTGGKRP
jgi:cell wall-associated NlpC family hydrolase